MKLLLDIDEACLFQPRPLQSLADDSEAGFEPHGFSTFTEDPSPLTHGARRRHRVIVAAEETIVIERFNPTARLQNLECLCEQRVPIGHAADQESHVYIIEGVGLKCPFLGEVVDLTVIGGATRQLVEVRKEERRKSEHLQMYIGR
jgi:hypothetical protein